MSDHSHFKVQQIPATDFGLVNVVIEYKGETLQVSLHGLLQALSSKPAVIVHKAIDCKEAGCNE